MKIAVRVISVVGLVFFTAYLILCLLLSGMSDSTTGPAPGPVFFFFITPYLYLAYCLYSTFDRLKGKVLLISGIVAHLAMLPLVIITLHGFPPAFIGIGILVMIAAWFGMYFEERIKKTALGAKYMAVRGRFWQIVFIVAILAFAILFIVVSLL